LWETGQSRRCSSDRPPATTRSARPTELHSQTHHASSNETRLYGAQCVPTSCLDIPVPANVPGISAAKPHTPLPASPSPGLRADAPDCILPGTCPSLAAAPADCLLVASL